MPLELKTRFSDAESFMFFYEGLRSYQLYQDDRRRSDLEDALASFERAVQRYPDDYLPLYYLGLARALQMECSYDEPETRAVAYERALWALNTVVERAPDALKPSAQLAVLATERGAHAIPGAHASVTTFKVRNAAPPWGPWLLGFISPHTRRVTQEKVATQLQMEIASISLALANVPDAEARLRLASRLDEFERRLAAANLDGKATKQLTCDLHNSRGKLHAAAGELETAASYFRQAIALNPVWLPAKRGLLALLQQGLPPQPGEREALERDIKKYSEAAPVDPSSPESSDH